MMDTQPDVVNIDFSAIWRIIKKGKLFVFGITLVFTFIGVVYAFSQKEEFQVIGKILPEIQSKGGSIGQFAGLAALAGVDLAGAGSGVDAVRPDLYPDVLKSTPFFLSLFKEKVKNKNNKSTDFLEFYNSEVLNGKVKVDDLKNKYPQSADYISFNRQIEKNIEDLKERIICNYDKKVGVISISVKLPDPIVAAIVTRYSMNYLTQYIIDYRVEKQKRDLEFLKEKLDSAKGKYFNNQNKKASYTDKMPLNALRFQSADLQRERIESEYKISSTFYNSLLQKYEEAKLKMQQETPVIKILEPPVVPNVKSEPKRALIIFMFIFLGLIVSFIFIFIFRPNNENIFNY
ncbi:MAG: lipopolysaccharide biosynthesis protein [Cytophagaceae bacterium BCCC1]|nr:MAG: lipopolysaccharide biosynthesis protein [Cytophagaceae bacterium BCCC1]